MFAVDAVDDSTAGVNLPILIKLAGVRGEIREMRGTLRCRNTGDARRPDRARHVHSGTDDAGHGSGQRYRDRGERRRRARRADRAGRCRLQRTGLALFSGVSRFEKWPRCAMTGCVETRRRMSAIGTKNGHCKRSTRMIEDDPTRSFVIIRNHFSRANLPRTGDYK